MRRAENLLPALLVGAVFLLIGLLTLNAYGATWDEPLHRGWAESMWSYLRTGDAALIADLPGGGRYYGPFFYLLSYGTATIAHDLIGLPFTAANHLLTLVAASLGVVLTFLLTTTVATRRAAFAAAILLCLVPPFQAHAQYNPKDVPILTLTVATLLFATYAYRSRRARHAVVAGACLGIALSMKVTAVVVLPILFGAVLADVLARRAVTAAEVKSILSLTAAAAAAAAIALFATWPSLWREPAILIETVHYFGIGNFWEGDVLYFGERMLAADLPWHYMPVMLLLSMPLSIVALATLGAAVMLQSVLRRRASGVDPRPDASPNSSNVYDAGLLLLWIVLPLLLFMKPGLPRYDGIRQILFVLPALAILAGIVWDALSRVPAARVRRLLPAAGLIVVAWLTAESIRYYPHGGAYVNAPARAVLGPRLDTRFEVEYWGASYRDGARWLAATAGAESVVCVPVAAHVLDWQTDVWRSDLIRDCAQEPDFVMAITRTSQWPDEYTHLIGETPAFKLARAGSDLLHIYRTR